MSQITTHVLDTSAGMPAQGITIRLQKPGQGEESWHDLAYGTTNEDGRIPNFIDEETVIEPGIYRMLFETQYYFNSRGVKSFYPLVPVVFQIEDTSHYHIPLLLNPFGYSTYRGS